MPIAPPAAPLKPEVTPMAEGALLPFSSFTGADEGRRRPLRRSALPLIRPHTWLQAIGAQR
ncbi:hypothetical protein MESS2_1320013 [Mesorhizobium metallidurans STM 2683]|uniref:Uncharacterized protein n=1 Tax=Mesorhizobium metallidurans STM 2683 TaxID=1297569 RepID=M5EY76_9HYPH|nr:hypothetical protein MESS2_1320013 [Mesorhizobium metallidurans STM 2683]